MNIKNIKITNFKSMYGTHYFDFDELNGMVKIYGAVGTGKTALSEAILWGLFGQVKGHTNPNLVSWGENECEIELNLDTNGHSIYIRRNIKQQLYIEIDGKMMSVSNKKNAQQTLEELYDVPRIAIEKMCIISFNMFNSIIGMTPYETKCFLDDIFGFKAFTEYGDEIFIERKNSANELAGMQTLLEDTINQINNLNIKKERQKQEMSKVIDEDEINTQRAALVEQGKQLKEEYTKLNNEFKEADTKIYNKIVETGILGKKEKDYYSKFKSGKCPTCGAEIDSALIEASKERMTKYANEYRNLENERIKLSNEMKPKLHQYETEMTSIKNQIHNLDMKLSEYKNSLMIVDQNYDDIINDFVKKQETLNAKISELEVELGDWNEMTELFAKTLRYKLLDTLIPHINSRIQFYLNKFEQNYKVRFDQEFKSHIYTDSTDTEISYNDLSTGQKKSLDLTIIFGILDNIISNVNFNVFFLDELFTNMDANLRNTILGVIKDTISKNRTIFVINHADMSDDYFNHKIKTSLTNKKILASKKRLKTKEDKVVIVKKSNYEQIF